MPTFRGFNTIGQSKKFGLTDFELIKRDLLNAFLIREGEQPGRPDLGTSLWNYVFEPMVSEVRTAIYDEVERIIGLDPRLEMSKIDISSNENTVIVEVAVVVLPETSPEQLTFVFERDSNSASIL